MEPKLQMEIQLGHMCNNRCVFCVSGQRTEFREAFPLPGDPIVAELERGFAEGIRKLTLLGGEPTLQPEFMRVLQAAVDMGFEEIVVFTNGVKTARPAFVDEILATGGNLTWRLSFQGADQESHERTTKKPGSFRRLVRTLENLQAKDQRITVNMCVVRSNFESVAAFPQLLLPFGVRQLHLDMVRPLDAGKRSEAEMREMLPYYSDMVPHLTRMIEGFPPGFDVNIGNLPYCVAPRLAPWIRHDGEQTLTVAIDGDDNLSEPWDKYEVKRRDKIKPASCRTCAFDVQCSGVFETYRGFYGLGELKPIPASALPTIDPDYQLFPLHVEPLLSPILEPNSALQQKLKQILALNKLPSPPSARRDSRESEVILWLPLQENDKPLTLALRPPGAGFASSKRASLHLLDAPALPPPLLSELLQMLARELFKAEGEDLLWLHPPGDDAVFQPEAGLAGGINVVLGLRLQQLRSKAPFGALNWEQTRVSKDGQGAELSLGAGEGKLKIQLASTGRGISGRYRIEELGSMEREMSVAVQEIFSVLKSPLPRLSPKRRNPPPPRPPAPARPAARDAQPNPTSLPVLQSR